MPQLITVTDRSSSANPNLPVSDFLRGRHQAQTQEFGRFRNNRVILHAVTARSEANDGIQTIESTPRNSDNFIAFNVIGNELDRMSY
jgi:hypothetical protein